MQSDPLATIEELGKEFKGKIAPTNFYDGNVCTWIHPRNRPWELSVTSGEPFIKELRFDYRKHGIRVFANNWFLGLEVTGSLPIEPFSINRENANYPLLEPATDLTIGKRQYSSFAKSGTYSLDQSALFTKSSFKRLVYELDLQARESLHFTAGNIYVYLEYSSTRRAVNAIENLISVAEDIERPIEGPDLGALPRQFEPIVPLVKKWAIDDDSDRERFLESLPKSTLESLIAAFGPFLRSIDSYLDSLGNHPSEATCALGRLAECTLEAKRLLKERT
jgi:hypothetical protein